MSLEQLSKTVDFVQDATPTDANDGETYLDTSRSPPQLKVFDASAGSFIRPRSIQNLDAPVSEAGASAEVKRLDLRFVREMSRLFFDRSLAGLNFSEGTFEIFADRNNITTSSNVFVQPGTNGKVSITDRFEIEEGSRSGVSIPTQDSSSKGVEFSDDGGTMVTVGSSSTQFYEYSLSTAFEIDSASFTGQTLNTQDSSPIGMAITNNGTTMIEVGNDSTQFYEYSLTTAFDIGSASFTGTTLNTQDSSPRAVAFSNDGTTMVELGENSTQFYEYSLTTAFDIGSASFTGTTLAATDPRTKSLSFNRDGTVMFELGDRGLDIRDFSLATPFDISTASFIGNTINLKDFNPRDMAFSSPGGKMVVVGDVDDKIREYTGLFRRVTGTGTVSKTLTLGFTPTTAVVEDTPENGLNMSYDITDGNGNTVSVSQTEVGTTVDCSALTDGSLTVTANLDNPTTAANALRDFAVYFD